MHKTKLVFTALTAGLLLAGCQNEMTEMVEAPEPKYSTPEEQIAELQTDFKEIIAETDSDYGKLVFYSLENKDDQTGVGLAVFDDNTGGWVYSDGTAHLMDPGHDTTAFPSDRIELSEDIQVVYGYNNESPQEGIQEVAADELVGNGLPVSESTVSYTFVDPEQDISVLPN